MPAGDLIDDVAGTDLASRSTLATASMSPVRQAARASHSLGAVTLACGIPSRDEVDGGQL